MVSMPIHAVPKPDGDKRMVTNHSAGDFALNSLISSTSTTGAPLDGLKHLANSLIEMRRIHGDAELSVFKSDVKGAHRLMPLCPEFQIKQPLTASATSTGVAASGTVFLLAVF
jgi:hypothetical protein